jgi:hypothetical protein
MNEDIKNSWLTKSTATNNKFAQGGVDVWLAKLVVI